ncbi:MAG: hypothetical protein KC431_08565 [Myxococcales bacterium]|nr:hypothetical protein [Myxococcales bacterium]
MVASLAMRPSLSALALTLAALALACSKPPDISGELDDYAYQINDVAAETCECPQDVGYATYAECVDDLSVTDAERDCRATVLEGHEEAGKEYLDCAVEALNGYVDCLAMNPGCADGWWADCTSAYLDTVGGCPQLPSAVAEDFAQCDL